MLLKPIRLLLAFNFIMILFQVSLPSGNVHAMASDSFNGMELPSLNLFIEQVSNGQTGEVRGVYIPDILAAPIVQQPAGKKDFVSPWQNVVTQFSMATRLGSTGLLAHNFLAGEAFALLEEGREIYLIHGDGEISTFIVTEILQYQTLDSNTFVDLGTHKSITASSLFTRVYNRPGQVVFQTCIQSGDDPNWGRLFVIAEPFPQ